MSCAKAFASLETNSAEPWKKSDPCARQRVVVCFFDRPPTQLRPILLARLTELKKSNTFAFKRRDTEKINKSATLTPNELVSQGIGHAPEAQGQGFGICALGGQNAGMIVEARQRKMLRCMYFVRVCA